MNQRKANIENAKTWKRQNLMMIGILKTRIEEDAKTLNPHIAQHETRELLNNLLNTMGI